MSKLTDLWPRVREIVSTAERPSRYINHEWGSVYKKDADFHFCGKEALPDKPYCAEHAAVAYVSAKSVR